MHKAAVNEREEIAKVLINNKVEINAKNKNDKAPLGLATENGYEGVVELLKKHRAIQINNESNGPSSPPAT